MKFTTLENILGFSPAPECYEERVQKRYDYIQEQLQLDPDFVAYDYLEYRNVHSDTLWSSTDHIVDTRGNVYLNTNGVWKKSKVKSKYGQEVSIDGKSLYFKRGRMLAHMFIPRPERLLKTPFYKLDIKYKDKALWNDDINNLEWTVIKNPGVYFSELPKTLTEILELKYNETMTYEERVQKRYNYIKEQLEKDPNYEGWDVVECIRKSSEYKHLVIFDYLISTSGKCLSLHRSRNGHKVMVPSVPRGYSILYFYSKEMRHLLSSHRVVASTFIPKSSTYVQKLNTLVVNHKDLNKLNNHFTNLEWCTDQENTRHQLIEYGAVTTLFNGIFEGTVLIEGKYNGTKFKVFGSEGLREIGINSDIISNYFTRQRERAFGCSWKYITQEEATQLLPIPEFIKDKLLHDKKYMDVRIIPIKGRVVKDCKYKGLEFVAYGGKEFTALGISHDNVLNGCRNGKVQYGCTWEFISRDEAELLQRGLTKDQQKVIFSTFNGI